MSEKMHTHRVADAVRAVVGDELALAGVTVQGSGDVYVLVGDLQTGSVLVGTPAEMLTFLEQVTDAVRGVAGLPARPGLEILDVRDPDSGSEVTVFLDGVEVPAREYEQYNVDPGAGYPLSGWREETREVGADPARSAAFRGAIVAARKNAESSEYVEDDLGDVGHFDGDGCAVYQIGYEVLADGDDERHPPYSVKVEDLTAGDTYRDPAADGEDVWLDVCAVVVTLEDENVHVQVLPEEDETALGI